MRDFGVKAAQQGQNLPAVHAVEGGIEEDSLDACLGSGEGLLHGGGFDHAVTVAGQLGGD